MSPSPIQLAKLLHLDPPAVYESKKGIIIPALGIRAFCVYAAEQLGEFSDDAPIDRLRTAIERQLANV